MITAVGVTSFVLCEAGRSTACLRMSIPSDAMVFRAREAAEAGTALPITCVPPSGDAHTFKVLMA